MIAGAVLVVVVVVAVAALVGAGALGSGSVTAAPSPTPSVAASSPTRGTSPTAPTTEPALTSPDGLVRIDSTAAAGVPVATHQAVLDVLHRHFTAINTLDFNAWAATVVPRRAQDQSADSWSEAFATTRDESVTVTSLTPTGSDSVLVGLSFVSNQAVADAPADLPVERICWQTRWPVVGISTAGRIDAPPSGTTTKRAC